MNKIFKCLIRFLIEVIVMTVLIVGINIFTNGMYLWRLPRINNIQSVNITYPSVTDDVKEISSREDIELALKLTGFLKYDLFEKVWRVACSCPQRSASRSFCRYPGRSEDDLFCPGLLHSPAVHRLHSWLLYTSCTTAPGGRGH